MFPMLMLMLLASSVTSQTTDYCQPNALIPDDLPQCDSCSKRCGTLSEYFSIPLSTPRNQNLNLCSCDEFCGFNGDCCPDFQDFCPDEFQRFQSTTKSHSFPFTFRDFSCFRFKHKWRDELATSLMIHTCSSDGSECKYTSSVRGSLDPNTFVPVYEPRRGVHYISAQCALCNGATEVSLWDVQLECSPSFGSYATGPDGGARGPEVSTITSLGSLKEILDSGQSCSFLYAPSGPPRVCPTSFISDILAICPSTCRNQRLVSLCESRGQALVFSLSEDPKIAYRNKFCALCHGQTKATCDYPTIVLAGRPGPPGFPSVSLTLVFDFDPRRGVTVGEHPPAPECNPREVYVPAENICRLTVIPEISNMTAVVKGTLATTTTPRMTPVIPGNVMTIEENVQDAIVTVLEIFNVDHASVHSQTEIELFDNQYSSRTYFQCKCVFNLTKWDSSETFVNRLERAVAEKLREVIVDHLIQQNIRVNSATVELQSELDINAAILVSSNQQDCTWLVYRHNETSQENNSVVVIATQRVYLPGMYQLTDTAVIVCETDLGSETETDSDWTLDLITFICVGISIICLVIRICLQSCINAFQNRPGRLHLQLAIALLIAFVMLIVGSFLADWSEACTTAAVVVGYGFLAAFVWMNVIALDTYLIFRPSAAFYRASRVEADRSLVVHLIAGWGIPALLVTIPLVVNFVGNIDSRFDPDFGGSRCWYTQRYAMLVFFGAPVMISLLFNAIVYVLTVISLRRAFKSSSIATTASDHHFAVYVRLFILMGITWVLGILSAFTDSVVIDIIFVVLNALQGLFLFISFVCSKVVLSEIRKKRQARGETGNSSEPKGRTRTTPFASSSSNQRNSTV